MAILDTTTWSWVDVPIVGPQPPYFFDGTMTLLESSKLVLATGTFKPDSDLNTLKLT
jgi:hypothetical protein